jgi:hypothetical protein
VARALDRQGHRRGGWGPAAGAAGGLTDEYFVVNQGGRFAVSLGWCLLGVDRSPGMCRGVVVWCVCGKWLLMVAADQLPGGPV